VTGAIKLRSYRNVVIKNCTVGGFPRAPKPRAPLVIAPPDYAIRATLTRDGFVERWGSGLGVPGVEIPVTWTERIAAWWRR
jgi:hypothetical protein